MTERYLISDPPTRAEIEAATVAIDTELDSLTASGIELTATGTFVGVAGTITTMAAIALGLADYDRIAIHHSQIARAEATRISERLLAMTVAQRRAIGAMHPGRADVIGAGALILERILRRTSVPEVLVSEHDILDGIAWSLVGEQL